MKCLICDRKVKGNKSYTGFYVNETCINLMFCSQFCFLEFVKRSMRNYVTFRRMIIRLLREGV